MQQAELAQLIGEHPSWVSRRLGETRRITIDDLERIARALGVGAVDLLPRDVRKACEDISGYPHRPERVADVGPIGRPSRMDASPPRRTGSERPVRIIPAQRPMSGVLPVVA
jgi:transcriptional regulator with XRE-family HTH domain